MMQPRVCFRPHGGQPDHADPAQTEAHPVAMAGEVLIQQGLHAHPRQLGQQQGDVIDTFADDAQSLGHAESLPPCSKPLEI
jgi:hypothetical protein